MTLIIFDFDGVIVDTDSARTRFIKEKFKERGIEIDDDTLKKMVGRHTEDFLKKFTQLEEKEINSIIAEKNKEILKFFVLNKNVKEALENLKPEHKIALATSNAKRVVMHTLKRFGISHLFDFIATSEDVDKEKPHPEVLFKVLKHFKAKDAWVVEDSETGLETVKAAGLRTILFRHGFNKDLNADYIINDFSELTSIVD